MTAIESTTIETNTEITTIKGNFHFTNNLDSFFNPKIFQSASQQLEVPRRTVNVDQLYAKEHRLVMRQAMDSA